jgi:hypothetical protein
MIRMPLTVGENRILTEILAIAGGLCVTAELSKLNEEQRDNIHGLKVKGYVVLTQKYFTVVLPPSKKLRTQKPP